MSPPRFRPFASPTMALLLCLALTATACASKKAYVPPAEGQLKSLYTDSEWDRYRGTPDDPRTTFEQQDYICRLNSTQVGEQLNGVQRMMRLELEALEAEFEAEENPPKEDESANRETQANEAGEGDGQAEGDEAEAVEIDMGFKLGASVELDPERYEACLKEAGYGLEDVEAFDYSQSVLTNLARCWRIPGDPKPCADAIRFVDSMEDNKIWFVLYNAAMGGCLQGDSWACGQVAYLSEDVDRFDKRQVDLRISRQNYADVNEPPPSWRFYGTRRWEQECSEGCAWCCVLMSRWHTNALGGDPDLATDFLQKACDQDPTYCSKARTGR